MLNYSFWADEAYISGFARKFIQGGIDLPNLLNSSGVLYQKLQTIIIAVFFKIFGISEFSARLPSLLAFFFGAAIIFLLAKKISNIYAASISAFIFAFSNLNLAYATQAKPYELLEVILLSVILLLCMAVKEKRYDKLVIYNLSAIVLISIATLLHNIGMFYWIIYGIFFLIQLPKIKINSIYGNFRFPIFIYFLFFATVVIVIISAREILETIYVSLAKQKILQYNNIYQVVKIFGYKYSLISTSALFGFIWSYKKNKAINFPILVYSLILLIFATFVTYIFNIRYVLSLFGIMFLYFGIFWAMVGEKYFPKKPWLIPLAVIAILYVTGYKIIRLPQAYYNPNIDKYGDVQIANYKDFYAKLKKQFPNYKGLYIVNNTFDAEDWYMGRYSNAYFMKFTDKPYKHHTARAMVYGSLDDFKKIIKRNPKGLLIMEDWQSFLPDDIKLYAKKNLKLEFRVESLKEAPNDPWPLALYSWGMP